MKAMVLLIGEQPIPNLIPVRIEKPEAVLLAYSERTALQKDRLRELIQADLRHVIEIKVEAFSLAACTAALSDAIEQQLWLPDQITFNLTGGTKLMMLAAFNVARQLGARCIYYQTEGNANLLHEYTFDSDGHTAHAPQRSR